MYGDLAVGGDVSLIPSLTPFSSTHPGLTSRLSSHASSYLLPVPTSSSLDALPIPLSSRPVPAAPLPLRSDTTPGLDTAIESTPSSIKFGESNSDLEAFTFRGSRGIGLKQEDIDTQRLQQLGYDAVLGRDYTFWSSLSISWLNIGCLQVPYLLRVDFVEVADEAVGNDICCLWCI